MFFDMKQGKIKDLPLVQVSSRDNAQYQSKLGQIVLPGTLLEYNRVYASNSYVMQNLHRISDKLPPEEEIYIISHDVTSSFPLHRHSYFELNYICQGSLINMVDGNEIYMSAGDLALLNPKASHELRNPTENTLLINFCIEKQAFYGTLKKFYLEENPVSDFLRDAHKEKRNFMFFSLGHNIQAQTIISGILQEYAENKFHQSCALEAWLILFFANLVKMNAFSFYGMDTRSKEIIEFIKGNCLHMSMSEIAGRLGYNASYLSSYIKKHTGRNCKDLIQETKLNEALRLLAEPDYNIYDIAENCGYSSASHFFRIFRETYGMTPGEYKKQMMR